MKKIFNFSAIVLCCSALVSLTSCDNDAFLTTTQYDIVSSEAMYESDANAIMGMNGVYDMMIPDGDDGLNTGDWGFKPNLFTGCHPTIDTQATGWDKDWNVQNWNASSSELLQGWKHAYIGISRANDFLTGLQTSKNLSESVKKTLEGEARASRAFFFHWLATTFGRVPMLETGETYTNTPEKARAETYVEMWDFIIEDLSAAADLLDWKPLNGQYGRCTKGMALSYLGDAYMWKAYRLTDGANGQTQDAAMAKECYQKAQSAFNQVLTSGVYELNKSFTTLWDMAGVWDKEAIWEEVLDEGENWGNWSNYTSRMFTKYYTACPENGGWGSLFLSWEWWSIYEKGDKRREASGVTGAVPQIDPTDAKYSAEYAGWYEPNVYGYHPYIQQTIGQAEATKTKQFHFFNGEYAPSIWSIKFWRNARAGWDGDTWCPTQIHWKRLPNVMLDYAECCFILGEPAKGWEQINKLRNRAFGNLEVGHADELTAKYLPPIQSMMQFYINKGQAGVIPATYPLPFSEAAVTVPDAETFYTLYKAVKGYSSEVWKVAVNLERRKEFNCEWCLRPDMQRSGFMADHVATAYPKQNVEDLTNIPWTNRNYDYNEQKMDMPIPSDELVKNPLCDQNPGY